MRQVTWLGQIQFGGQFPGPCSASNPCPAGFNCINGACVPARLPTTPPRINPALIPALQPVAPPEKKDNTVFWVLGAVIGAGILYYAIQ